MEWWKAQRFELKWLLLSGYVIWRNLTSSSLCLLFCETGRMSNSAAFLGGLNMRVRCQHSAWWVAHGRHSLVIFSFPVWSFPKCLGVDGHHFSDVLSDFSFLLSIQTVTLSLGNCPWRNHRLVQKRKDCNLEELWLSLFTSPHKLPK